MEQVVVDYLKYLDIPISADYCKKCILSHPDYPSLLSIADTLERLGIDHQIGQVEQKSWDTLQFPCLLHIESQGSRLQLVRNRADIDRKNISLKDWDGIVLKAEATNAITDGNHNERYQSDKHQRKFSIVLSAALMTLCIVGAFKASSLLTLSLLATSVAGAVISCFLIAKDLGITYKPVETFCNAGKRTNCDRILNAKDANIVGIFGFTDAAISYFLFQLVTAGILISSLGNNASWLWVLAVAALFTLPVIGYSLYYQQVIAKTWCRLCVLIDIILGLQIGLFTMMYYGEMFTLTSVQVFPVVVLVLLFTAIASAILLIKERMKITEGLGQAEAIAKRVKHDPKVFTELLLESEKIDITPLSPEMTIGNREAPLKIMMVANLHCNPCRIAFNTIRQLLSIYPQKIHFAVRFTKGMDNTIGSLSASTYLIRYWYQNIYRSENEAKGTKNILEDWYEVMNPQMFLKKYPDSDDLSKVAGNGTNTLENQHYQWVKQHSINRTPTFFLNGYEMPKNYRIKDLMALIPGLASLWKGKKLMEKSAKEFA